MNQVQPRQKKDPDKVIGNRNWHKLLLDEKKQKTSDKTTRRRALHQQGLNDREIAEKEGVTRKVITGWRRYRGLPVNREKRDYVERRALYEQGLSDGEIAKRLGFTRATINAWRRNQGLPNVFGRNRRIPRNKEEVKIIVDFILKGLTNSEITLKTSRSNTFIGKIRKEHGFPPSPGKKDNFREYQERKYGEFNRKVINLYHKHPEWNWYELSKAVDLEPTRKNLGKIKTIVGRHLMRVCRSQEKCAYKALLPEYEEVP